MRSTADSFMEKGREEGREEGEVIGLEKGEVIGQVKILARFLTKKYGEAQAKPYLPQLNDMSEEQLDRLSELLLDFESIDALFDAI